jgi:radical SAM superfamily enzyme YgiQ (UPF0313 family)
VILFHVLMREEIEIMRVLLISANTEPINMPTLPLGLACVASATQNAGHDVELLDLLNYDDIAVPIKNTIEGFKPELIGVSVRNIDDQDMEEPKFLLDRAKETVACCKVFSEAPVVLGGAGYSIFPETALTYLGADMGIQGEGEHSFPLLIDRIMQNIPVSGFPGLYLPGQGLQGKRAFIYDLERFPLPDTHLLSMCRYEKRDLWLPVQTRRGCPFRCSYCSTQTIEGSRIRKRSPDSIVKWLTTWVESGYRRFHFVDNTFNIPPSYANALCSRIIEAGLDISWRCILYPGNISESLIGNMAMAGCKDVALGFESGSESILRGMDKRFMLKDVREASKALADHRIHRMGFLLLGGPGETRQTVEESLSFAESINLDSLKLTLGIRIYPGTKLSEIAVEQGLISENDDLLFPKFYMVKEIEDWLREIVSSCLNRHTNWMT